MNHFWLFVCPKKCTYTGNNYIILIGVNSKHLFFGLLRPSDSKCVTILHADRSSKVPDNYVRFAIFI